MIEITDEEFREKVLKRSLKIPVVVDFWAPMSTSCKILNPILERMEKRYRKRFVLAKINIVENKETAKTYEVENIPSVKMIKEGKVVAEFAGALSDKVIKEWLNRNL